MSSSPLTPVLEQVRALAARDAAGDVTAHGPLLEAIRRLQLAAETPLETTSRINFQVRPVRSVGKAWPPVVTRDVLLKLEVIRAWPRLCVCDADGVMPTA